MPTIFALLCQQCGLSLAEAAEFLCAPLQTVKMWSNGSRTCGEVNLGELHHLAYLIDQQAKIHVKRLKRLKTPINLSDIPRNFKIEGAYHAMLGRIIALLPDETEYE